ncbi:hypothetical protein ACI77J_25340 [Pseudomonas sp. O64]|uniref:hypothetical protein n=2 Tax=unclassified Pseudomonas TaxID=196821 RepID=UPI00387AF4C7
MNQAFRVVPPSYSTVVKPMISTQYPRTFIQNALDNVPKTPALAKPEEAAKPSQAGKSQQEAGSAARGASRRTVAGPESQAMPQLEQQASAPEGKPARAPLSLREHAITRLKRSFADSDQTLTLPGTVSDIDTVKPPALTQAQIAGDSELAQIFSPMLTRVVGLSQKTPEIVGELPKDATFTSWWGHFYDTFQSPDYKEWAKNIGLDTSTVVYSPKDGSLSGQVNGQQKSFQPGDDSGWTQVATPIWAASEIVAPHTTAISTDSTFKRDTAPFEAIADFYGEPLDVTPQVARTRADQIFQSKAFAPLDPNDPSRQPADRTPHSLKLHHHALTRYRAEYAARKTGDGMLAIHYADGLRSTPAGTQIALPQTSELKAWWQHFYTAFQDPAYVDWAQQKGFDRSSAVFSAVDGSLSGLVNGKLTSFTQHDDSGWAKVCAFIWDAAKVVAPGVDAIRTGSTFNSNAAPPEIIAAFYGERHNLSPQDALNRAAELSSTGTFTPLAASSTPGRLAARSKVALEAQQGALTAHQQHYAKQQATAAGDIELAGYYRTDLLSARAGHYRASVYTSGIPQASSFGQAWHHFYNTLQSQDYLDWAKKTGIDPSTVTVFPQDGGLSARKNGELIRFTQTDNSGWAQVSGPIWKAAITVAPQIQALSAKPPFSADTAPFEVIADFYGEQHDITPSQANARAAQFGTPPTFVPLDPNDPLRPPALRSLAGIEQQRQELLESRQHYGVQAAADSELAVRYGAMLKYARAGETPLEAQIADISPNSEFGRWWQQLYAAFQAPEYVDWAKRNGIEMATASFSPKDGTLSANVNGKLTTFTQAQNPEWAYISQPIWAAAKVAAPKASAIHTDKAFKPNSVPFARVGEFYGENPELTGAAAMARATALAASKSFTDDDLDNPLRRPMDRTQAALQAQQLALLDRYDDDRARKAGDSELAVSYANGLLTGLTGVARRDISVPVPAGSTFGQWWRHFNDALQSPDFLAWVKENRLDPTQLTFDPEKAQLVAKVDGKEVTFSQHDRSGWAQVSGPILHVGKLLLGRHRKLIDLTQLDKKNAPLLVVEQFYGERSLLRAPAIQQRALELQARKAFEAPVQFVARSSQALGTQRQTLADAADKHHLLVALRAVYEEAKKDPKIDISARLKDTDMEVEPDSSFSNYNDMGLEDQTSLHGFLSSSGVSVPTNLAQLANMIAVLDNPLPAPPANGNFWGLMSRSQPLSNLQKTGIQDISRLETQALGAKEGGLFNAFAQKNSGLITPIDPQLRPGQSNPEAMLARLVASPEAQALGQKLEASLNDVSPASSVNERVLAALVLDLDPGAGTKRNHVAGFDLASSANWGHTPATIFQRLVDHLVTHKKIQREIAPAAANLLLAGAAPEFLLKGLPGDLRYGSHTWASLSAAVSRIEQDSPGASRRMTFEQVMIYGNTASVTPESTLAEGKAQENAAVDWAVTKGVIEKNDTGLYSAAQATTAVDAFNKVIEESSKHADAFTKPIPSQQETALRILKQTYGRQYDYTTPVARITTQEADDSQLHSAVDLYIEDKLGSVQKTGQGVGVEIGHGQYISNATALPKAKVEFDKEFDKYRNNALAALKYSIEQTISTLPLEEQKRLQTNKIDIYALHQVDPQSPPAFVEGKQSDSPARLGVIIKVHGKTVRDNATLYEYFPLRGVFRKRDDIDNNFPYINTPRRQDETFGAGAFRDLTDGIPLNIDYSAYSVGSQPQDGKTSNNIRIEPIVSGKPVSVSQTKQAMANYISRSIGDFVFDKKFWRAESSVETERKAIVARLEWMRKAYIPGMNTFEEFKQNGNTGAAQFSLVTDIFGFAFPVGRGGVQAAKLTGRLGSKLFNGSKTVAKSAVNGLKPATGFSNLMMRAPRGISSGVNSVRTTVINPRAAATANTASTQVPPRVNTVSNFTPVIDGSLLTFENTTKSGLTRLNIVLHGENIPLYKRVLGIYDTPVSGVINGQPAKPMDLLRELHKAGINPADKTKYDKVRLLMCNSGNGGGGGISFAENFNHLIGDRPLKAFKGTVGASTRYAPEGFVQAVKDLEIEAIKRGFNPALARTAAIASYNRGIVLLRVQKTNPFSLNPRSPDYNRTKYLTFVYKPVHY